MKEPPITYRFKDQEKNERKGLISSSIIHLIVLFLLLLPFFKFPIPPPGQQGILVSFGEPEIGEGTDSPDTQNELETETQQVAQAKAAETPSKPVAPPVPSKEAPKEILKSEIDPAIALEEKKEKERLNALRIKQEEEARKEREAEAKRLKEEETKRIAAEEEARKKAEFEEKKKQFGTVIGKGKGETETAGNQGDPAGNPDAKILKGISKGSGRVGEGLSDRGVLFEPEINENSQKTGRVVIRVCVNSRGKVISANFTQKGSTTTDSDLVKAASDSVMKYRFTESEISEQCGTVTIDFKVR